MTTCLFLTRTIQTTINPPKPYVGPLTATRANPVTGRRRTGQATSRPARGDKVATATTPGDVRFLRAATRATYGRALRSSTTAPTGYHRTRRRHDTARTHCSSPPSAWTRSAPPLHSTTWPTTTSRRLDNPTLTLYRITTPSSPRRHRAAGPAQPERLPPQTQHPPPSPQAHLVRPPPHHCRDSDTANPADRHAVHWGSVQQTLRTAPLP